MDSDSSTSSETDEKIVTEEQNNLDLVPTTQYDDEELATLQTYMQRMSLLFALEQTDWKEQTLDVMRQFLYETNHLLLTIFYDCNELTACLGIPLAPAYDMCYFLRKPGQVLRANTFFDEINFGNMHEDVDGCLLRVLERVFSPLFRNFSSWNDNIRLRFCKALDMFLSYLTGLHYKLEGMTLLYIPYVLKQLTQQSNLSNREFVRNLEIIAVYWTTQIRNLLSDKTTPQHDFVVPSAEYEFWLYRYEVLYGLNVQLKQQDIVDIISVLRNTQSVYLKQWEDLVTECDTQMQEARSNLKYLKLLITPCQKIDMAKSPEDIPALLPRIFHIMRYIWVKSEFYNRSELITKLFRQLSNQVIKFCISKINIEKVLQGQSRFGIKMANLSIDCCLAYKTIYDIMSNEQSKQSPALEWNLDKAMIFNHVDAFIERLYDVIDICEAMIVFGRMVEDEKIPPPKFAGTNGNEFEKTCARVEEEFLLVLSNLESDGKELILNVNKNEWYDEVLKYRKAVKSFEETTQRLLSNVFQRICNTEEILETLNVTLYYSFRASLKTTYMRQVAKLWLQFEKDMTVTSNMLADKANVHESWLPYYSSRAINYRINIERLSWLFSRIINSEWLPNVPEARIITAKFEKLKVDYEREVQKMFTEWSKQCGGASLAKKLDNTLIIRSKLKIGLLECNMDPAVLNTCEQAEHFEFLGFTLPGNIKKVYEKYGTLKTTYNCVVKVCLDYNKILAALSMEERKLFRELVRACDRKIAPGVFKLSWGGELSDAYIADCAKYTGKLQETLDIYKRSNRNIARLCEQICDTPFFKLTHFNPTELHVFEQSMMLYCDLAMEKVLSYYNTITELIFVVYREFHSVIDEMQNEWIKYLQKLDDMLATSVLVTCRNSLTNLLNAIRYTEDQPPAPILVIKVDIVNREITLNPNVDDVLKLFKNLAAHLYVMLESLPRLSSKFALPVDRQGAPISSLYQSDEECSDLQQLMESEIIASKSEVNNFVQRWGIYRDIWEKTEEDYLEFLKTTKLEAKMFQDTLDTYANLTDEITLAESLTAVNFMMINQNNIKSTLLEMLENWTAFNLKILQVKATSKLKSIYRYMRSNAKRVMKRPNNLAEVRAFGDFQLLLKQEVKTKHDKFRELYNKFHLLDEYQAFVPTSTRKALQKLEDEWKKYLQKLHDGEEVLENARSGFKANFLFQADRFKSIVKDFFINFMAHMPTSSQTHPKLALKFLNIVDEKLQECITYERNLIQDLAFFNINQIENQYLKQLSSELQIIKSIWEVINQWKTAYDKWGEDLFWNINIDDMEDLAISLNKEIGAMNKRYYDRQWDMLKYYAKAAEAFRKTLPLITALRNPNMRQRHWDQVRKVVNVNFDEKDASFTFRYIFNMDFQAYSEEIQDISYAATMERQIEINIHNIAAIWRKQGFEMMLHRDNIYRMKNLDECFQYLEEHLVQISAMKATRFVEPFLAEADFWEKSLAYIMEVFERALSVQKQWLYLENIFQGDDIRKTLPNEAKRFAVITEEFRLIMQKMHEAQLAFKATHLRKPPFLLQRFEVMDERLELIQRALEVYLETKRQAFPRFYFISNDDLLEILGNAKRPDLIQTHLKKLFDNLHKLELKRAGKTLSRWTASGMYADDGEFVEFLTVLYIEGPSEKWLAAVEDLMFATMREKLKETRISFKKLSANREKWISLWPGQCVLTNCQIQWTTECTRSLLHCKLVDQKKPLRKLKRKQTKVLNALSEHSRKDLSKIMRLKINTLITIEIHGRDVIERMYKVNCRDVSHFEWFSQLRFYWLRNIERCVIRQTNTEHQYGYEYTGNSGRLVITPLTDRCYITLTTALHLHRGGSPKGPAGTGKTETVKDLGKALGMWVIVTNCSEGLDFKSIGKNFSGLAQCGTWGCFDEFNRINIEVLSVVAQQITTILTALAAQLSVVNFEGQLINIKPTVGIFITMNPGYAGRTELPDNLKSMFRPISMMVPDNIIIAENLLFSDGFSNTRNLARKVFTLYELAKQQLSKQYHYDFGLRSMVAMLRYAGRKRRLLANTSEEEVVYLAMRDMNVARLTANDLPLFNAIMTDIFPGVQLPVIDYKHFQTALEEEIRARGLQLIPLTIKKVIELYETKNSRHSSMIIGDTCTAKTVTWQCLQGAFERMKKAKHAGWEAVEVYPINPKALTLAELYGEYNLATGEWLDGVLSAIMRVICADEDQTQKWLLFDGPVDAVWIESMNSVMDDNKILTLVNSERITMPQQVSLLFEVGDLAVASPATVSRCGMVFNDYKDFGWRPYVQSWLERQKSQMFATIISNYFDEYVDKVLNFKSSYCKETVPSNELNVVMSMCHLLQAFAHKSNGIDENNVELLDIMAKLWFMFCLVWSIGATVDDAGRVRMDAFIREMDSCFPIRDTIYDYFVDPINRSFIPWEAKLPLDYRYDDTLPFYRILIPTVDTVRYEYLVNSLLQHDHPVLLVGDVGTGKTSTAVSVMEACDRNKYTLLTINISAQTSAAGLQESIENKTEKRTKTLYAPVGGKRMICFMDDFNMPAKDTYGSQPPLELVRQWLDYKFWFNRRTQQKIFVQNTLLLAAMGPAGGGRTDISSRTLSRFSLINMTFPTDATISRIFGVMLQQKLQNFSNEVLESWQKITLGTITLFKQVLERMLPTPTKSHYLFNLRDISRVFQGLLRSQPECQTKKTQFLRLWVHECFRVFCDRLVDDLDTGWFMNKINDVLGAQFELTFHNLCANKMVPLFGDFLSPQGFYEELNYTDIRNYLIEQLKQLNNAAGESRLNLVFFREAVEHVTRIVRVISQPNGHLLNIGIGGTGRQCLVRMAAFIKEVHIFGIELNKKYKTHDFREDMKRLYKLCGVKQQETVFLFSGEQVADTSFLEIINNMLSTGEANLFKQDEFEDMKTELERAAKRAGVQLTTEAMYNFFMSRIRENLHVVLSLSPIGVEFRDYLRQYPALINCTTANWFRQWPREALLEVAQKFLANCKLHVPVPGRQNEVRRDSLIMSTEAVLQKSVAAVFAYIHGTVSEMSDIMWLEVKRRNYVTSPNYLELVGGFQVLLERKREEVSSSADKLRNGLSKIAQTQEKVLQMSEELKISSEQVKVLAKECEEFIVVIEAQKAEATEQKERVDAEAVIIRKEETVCMNLATTARADLEVVLPMIDAAIKALDALSKKDVSEIKSYGRPPMKIEKVMEAVLILLGKEPTWENAKRVLGEVNFLNDLKNFDRDNVSDKTLKRIGLYTKNPELEPSKVAVISVACKSLMEWILAIENYAKVYRIVAPKQEKLDSAMRSLAEKQALLAAAQQKLEQLIAKIEELYRQLKEKTELLEELRLKEERLRKQLERAIILVESLSGEQQRWIETVEQLDIAFEKLPGDCLISQAFLSYLGPFDTKYRDLLLVKWRKSIRKELIPHTMELKIALFLSDAVEIREWNIQGLPADEFSTENGVIVTQSARWPLIIDPQIQANSWIKNLENNNELLIIDFNMFDYIKILETALQNGNPVLLQNIGEHLDQAINPILRKSFVMQAGHKYVRFNDKYILYNDDFRLYMTTKNPNPHYQPEICSKTIIVNFAVKQSGLEAQLLGIIVRKEKPALEEQKDELVMTIARNKRTLKDLDNDILRLLNESRGSLLEDDELFATLQKSRQTSVLVKESLNTAEITELEIDAARQEYHAAAERAAILFFVLMDMYKIDPMYVFSLSSYILLFSQSIEKSARHALVRERNVLINDFHTYATYKNTCRGLFEAHKLLFSIHMAAKILEKANKLVIDEYEFILKGGIVLDKQNQPPNPATSWISEQAWDNITELDKVAGFHGIMDSFESNAKLWQAWYATTSPETEKLVGEWNDKLTDFQKICVVRCLRPDRISFCLTEFIISVLGQRFVEPPVLDLKAAYEESLPQTPLIFVLSPGVDPAQALFTLAEQMKMSNRMYSVSLGQGQAPVATKNIMDGVKDGNWVFLANCHLSLSWMPSLDKIISTMQNMKLHKRFRLWMSSNPHPEFPISILQSSIKMTTEPPRGIKANMKRLYGMLTDENLEQCKEPHKYKKLLFSLCFFHTILLERKKFQQLGWNVVYSFNDSDFEVSEILLAVYLNEYEETPWDALKYLIAGVNYGGHVTDDWDRRLLLTYINQYFCEAALTTQKYKFSNLQNYFIPPDGDLQSYIDQIQQLPNFDKPEAFGQHPNADIASLIGEARTLFDVLNSMQIQTASAEGESKEEQVLRLCHDIAKNVPEEISYKQTAKLIGKNRTPLEVVLLQEIERYNDLLSRMKKQLRDVDRGIKGLVVMSTDVEDVFQALYEGRVPAKWLKSYFSLKPLAAWTRDLILRVDHFAAWAKLLRPPSLFWLAAYTFPTGFLTAVLQTSARATNTPIDELTWEFYVFVEDDAAAARVVREGGGVYIRSLYLEGAGWSRKMQHLQDPLPMELVCPMPVIHFKPEEIAKKRSRGFYQCPTYYYPLRSGSFVISVDLKSGSEKPDYWVKRGTALLLSLSD